MKILGCGCSTAAMWTGHKNVLSKCSWAVLSDFFRVMETIMKYMNMEGVYENTFSLDNGMKQLEPYFGEIKIECY